MSIYSSSQQLLTNKEIVHPHCWDYQFCKLRGPTGWTKKVNDMPSNSLTLSSNPQIGARIASFSEVWTRLSCVMTAMIVRAASQAEQARPHGWLPPIGSCSQCSTGCGTRIEAGSSCQYHTYQSFFIDLALFSRIQNALVKDVELSLPGFYRVCMGMATIIQSPWTTVKEDLLWSKTTVHICVAFLFMMFILTRVSHWYHWSPNVSVPASNWK